jgi:hypothetical protein
MEEERLGAYGTSVFIWFPSAQPHDSIMPFRDVGKTHTAPGEVEVGPERDI